MLCSGCVRKAQQGRQAVSVYKIAEISPMFSGMFYSGYQTESNDPDVYNPDAQLWYPDGDECAELKDNLGAGIVATEVAEFFCFCANSRVVALLYRLFGQLSKNKHRFDA